MAKDYRKEISFQAGELSPLFYGRSETEFYQKGLAIAKNVYIDKRGGAFRRNGARNRGQVAGNDCVSFTNQIHPNRFDTILIYDTEMLVISPEIDFASPNLLANGKFALEGASWTVTAATSASRAVFSNDVCTLKPQQNNGSQVVSIRQQATVTGGIGNSHTVRVQQATSEVLRIKIGTSAGGTEIDDVHTNREFFDHAFVPNNATYYIEVEVDGDVTRKATLVNVATLLTADLGGLGKTYSAPWSEDDLADLHIVETPEGEALYFLHPKHPPQKLVYTFSTDTYTALAAVVFTAAPASWTGTNYPATGTYFQGRLWLAATPDAPQTVWASNSNAPEDFTTGAGASNSWNFTLQQQGRIKWMLGTKNMLIGTENAEHVMSATDNLISQLDFDISQQSSYGSNSTQPIQVGEKVFYITPDGRRVNSMSYAWQEDNWLSQDLTFASEHVTEGIVRGRFWAQNPSSLYGLVLEDGSLAILTYDRTSETVGWSRYNFDDAVILSVSVGQIQGVSRLVYVVQRTVDEIEIEIEISSKVFMDSFSSEYYATPSDAISGLDHLEGVEVQVVVDGAVTEPQTVSGGAVTAAVSGTALYAGIMVHSKVTTLPPDVPQEQIRSWKKRWSKVWALLHLSAPPIINGVRPPDRSPSTPMDTPEPFSSRAYTTASLGWDENGQVTVEENLPVPMNLLAICGELARESL